MTTHKALAVGRPTAAPCAVTTRSRFSNLQRGPSAAVRAVALAASLVMSLTLLGAVVSGFTARGLVLVEANGAGHATVGASAALPT
jgi:hypothetical protein